MLPLLSFIVPVRDDAARLCRCLATIHDSAGGRPIEIIVADNGSSDDSAAVAVAAGARVIGLPDATVAVLRNTGARAARARLLAFVDADHELDRGWVAAALAVFEDAAVGAAGAQYHAPPDGSWQQRTYDRLRRRRAGSHGVDWLPSGNLIVRAEAFAGVGGFDTRLETCEDVDLCCRLRARGWTLIEADAIRSVHRGDPATLRALFFGELWRGRDNLRVSLRHAGVIRSLPSLFQAAGVLLGVVAIGAGLLAWPVGGWRVAVSGAIVVAALILLRTTLLVRRTPRAERRAASLWQTMIVSAAYDLARGGALVSGASHRVRRRSEAVPSALESPNRGR